MAAASRRTGAVARKGNARSAAAAAAGGPKNLGWMGARPRQGRWASELRLRRTRKRLWIGTFATPEQAALAYDAAIYCLYGADIPRSRRFNFPNAPRPNVPEGVRGQLTLRNIRAIAGNHALSLGNYYTPAVPPIMADPAAAVDAAAGPGAGAGAAAPTPIADHGNVNAMNDKVVSVEEFLNSISPEEFDAMMGDI